MREGRQEFIFHSNHALRFQAGCLFAFEQLFPFTHCALDADDVPGHF